MGQSGGAGRTERRTESCRCAGGQTKKYRRSDRPKRAESLESAGVCGTACIGRAKQEKVWEVRQARHTQQGQDRKLCPILQYPPPQPHPGQKPKKECERERGGIVIFLGFGAADSKKTKNEHISGCGIFAYHAPRFPLFP